MKKKKRRIQKSSVFDQSSGLNGEKPNSNAFSDRLKAQNIRAVQKASTELKQIQRDDPNLFNYDSFLDSRANDKSKPKEEKSQYIEKLKETAKTREFMYEKSINNVFKREQVEEDKKFGKASEIFVTSAYKKRLKEMEMWEESEKIKEKAQQSKQPDISQFYSRLLSTISNQNEVQEQNITVTPAQQKETEPVIVPQEKYEESQENLSETKLRTDDQDESESQAENKVIKPKKLDLTMIEAARNRALLRKQKGS